MCYLCLGKYFLSDHLNVFICQWIRVDVHIVCIVEVSHPWHLVGPCFGPGVGGICLQSTSHPSGSSPCSGYYNSASGPSNPHPAAQPIIRYAPAESGQAPFLFNYIQVHRIQNEKKLHPADVMYPSWIIVTDVIASSAISTTCYMKCSNYPICTYVCVYVCI